MNHLNSCVDRLEALDGYVTGLLGEECEEGEELKIHVISRCGCLQDIKTACHLFEVDGIPLAELKKDLLQYVPLDIESNLADAMQCLS